MSIELPYYRAVAATEPDTVVQNRIEDRSDIGQRFTDRVENFTGGGLLLQRLS